VSERERGGESERMKLVRERARVGAERRGKEEGGTT
jgi:hypothetical protein